MSTVQIEERLKTYKGKTKLQAAVAAAGHPQASEGLSSLTNSESTVRPSFFPPNPNSQYSQPDTLKFLAWLLAPL